MALLPPQRDRIRIVERLALKGVPLERSTDPVQYELLRLVESNTTRLHEIIHAILPSDAEMETAFGSDMHETMLWLKWLMFAGDPAEMPHRLAFMNGGKHGVCGSVWGQGDRAYRCRTCEHDPTCAFCVQCFENGDHKDHDYSMIITGGGCCDCGDVTACKDSGFCSEHQGAKLIQPLQKDIAKTLRPVLDILLHHWENKLKLAASNRQNRPADRKSKKVADVLTSAVVSMLLEFCECSESLLRFVSGRLCSEVNLFDLLVWAEMLLSTEVVKNLQKLLMKLPSDYCFKREFAKAFQKYYPIVVNKAVEKCDGSAYTKFPLLSTFSVQVFTVPSLVKELDPLTMLLNCLINIFSSCSREDNQLQVLQWGKLYEITHRVFEDIRFVMSHATLPSRTWMNVLAFVQGFSPQKRETGNHIEQEDYVNRHFPFLLGCSFAKIHALACAFSTEDESVPVIVEELLGTTKFNTANTSGGSEDYTSRLDALSLADWPDIKYDVSSQEISVHIPLHRLLSLVLHRALKRRYGEFESSAASSVELGDGFCNLLGDCHPYRFSASVMEHPLRIRVFCSQVRAGMWKKNGETAVLSYQCYRLVRWSELDLELDLFLLQCCAALAPADSYIARIKERFGLSAYFSLDNGRATEYEAVLVAEMLDLVIQIVKERRFCGLTTAQCLQRELINKLSHGNTTHSQLVKSLPHDLSKHDQFQQDLDTVAKYSPPSETKQGMYELRSEYWKEVDLYHPRWDSIMLEDAEKNFLQFCNVSPKWSTTYPPLKDLAKVATCKTVLQIIRVVLIYALPTDKSMPSRAPYRVLIAALHLLSLALDASQDQIQCGDVDNAIPLLAFAGEEISTGLYGFHDNCSLLSLLVSLMTINQEENVSGGLELSSFIKNLLQKFAKLDSGCRDKLEVLAPEVGNQQSHSNPSGGANKRASMSDSDKRKMELARAAKLEIINAHASKFKESLRSGLNDSGDAEEGSSDVENDSPGHRQEICLLCHERNSKSPVLFIVHLQKSRVVSLLDEGPPSLENGVQRSGKKQLSSSDSDLHTQTLSNPERVISTELLNLVQNAIRKLQSTHHQREVDAFKEFLRLRFPYSYNTFEVSEHAKVPNVPSVGGSSSKARPSSTYGGFGPSNCSGVYVSTCGHVVHQKCLDAHIGVTEERYLRFDHKGYLVKDLGREFLCPACRILANSVLPDLPRGGTRNEQLKSQFPCSLASNNDAFLLKQSLSLLQAAADVSKRNEFLELFSGKPNLGTSTDLEYVNHTLHKMYFPGDDKFSGSNWLSDSMMMLDTFKYSIISTEIAARSESTSSAEELRSSSGLILAPLLKVVQAQNSLDVLLRLMCVKKYAKSICCADTPNESPSDTYGVEESIMSMLESPGIGKQFSDVHLWTMASYPVLASDGFSTLMWILFCLPTISTSSEEAFFPLVHMCYVISITQAAISCVDINKMIDSSHQDSLISDIFNFVGEHRFLTQHFVSNHLEDSVDINKTIRRLSYPFLRRCAILWKLMNSSTSTATVSGIGIDELEKMFKIPTLDVIVSDEESRSLVKKWLQHIAKEFAVNNGSRVLHITPAVPFKLIYLPPLYQTLQQRYFKQKCVECGGVLLEPALCLLCGKLSSLSDRMSCCRDNDSQTHAMSCGAGTGIFLMTRVTNILVQISAYQAYLPSPYLDIHGEEDHEMRRGSPLYLNQKRYEALRYMVASHGLCQNPKVTDQTFVLQLRPSEE